MFDLYIEALEDLRELIKEGDSTYSEQIKITAPNWMKSAVSRGRKVRDNVSDSNKCCTAVGMRRATQIENDENLSLMTLKRMKSFAARHSAHANWDDPKSKQAQALLLWGVPFSPKGAKRFMAWCDTQIRKLEGQ